MKRIRFSSTIGLICVLCFAPVSNAGMSSANYRITSSVLTGGGTPTSSDNYQTDSTLGQASPLMDPADPPQSGSYDLYPGFWYTQVSIPQNDCPSDFNGDEDVDGADLADYIFDSDGLGLDVFAANFGKVNCP